MNCLVCGERIEPMGRYGSDKREAALKMASVFDLVLAQIKKGDTTRTIKKYVCRKSVQGRNSKICSDQPNHSMTMPRKFPERPVYILTRMSSSRPMIGQKFYVSRWRKGLNKG